MTNIFDGFTENPNNTEARRARIQAWSEQRQICAEMVAEVETMFDKLDEALVTAYSISEEMFPFIFQTSDTPVNQYVGRTAKGAELLKGVLNADGSLRSYTSYNEKTRGQLVDDHEVHSYTVDGE